MSDIIDNRDRKLADSINHILPSTDTARFAVGYFFLSGFKAISDRLRDVKELPLLIGTTTNRETLEQLAEGFQHLDLVRDKIESDRYANQAEVDRIKESVAKAARTNLELMDQSDQDESLAHTLVKMISEKRLLVRVYTKERLHAKAYIFSYGTVFNQRGEAIASPRNGDAIVGSSNLSLAGLTNNTELNVLVHGDQNHAQLVAWFDALWEDSQEFDEKLMFELQNSWVLSPASPYDVYMKALYTLVEDRLQGEMPAELLFDDAILKKLTLFQKRAAEKAIQIIQRYGGGFVSDVVGLGKSFIGAAVVKHFERFEHSRPLIICPAPLVELWEKYNESYRLNARVLSMGELQTEQGRIKLNASDGFYRDRDFVLVDESHNFRYPDTERYKALQGFLIQGRKACFLTATPQNKGAEDIYHQIKLFLPDDKTDIPIEPADLAEYFKKVDKGERRLQDLLSHLLVRRTRNHVLRWYGFDSETHQPVDPGNFEPYLNGERRAYVRVGTRHQYFPTRDLRTVEYNILSTYEGLYDEIRSKLCPVLKNKGSIVDVDSFRYARYALWDYVLKPFQNEEPYSSLKNAGTNLRGLMRVLIFKRLESSVEAFRKTLQRLIGVHDEFLQALELGFVPAGKEAQALLYEIESDDDPETLKELERRSSRYSADKFDIPRLKEDLRHDIELLKDLFEKTRPISADKDAKLQTLRRLLDEAPLRNAKQLIFTQYADTAQYLFENLCESRDDIDVIYSGDKSKLKIVGRFSPKSNPEYKRAAGESDLRTLIATDILAEGLNLQDCDNIINYDLHWNPVRLIQRFGRIDRIGSDHLVVHAFNFLPDSGMEKHLGLKRKLDDRIQEIHDVIGEDSAILHQGERLNPEAMYAIYEQRVGEALEETDENDFADLNEAEERFRQMMNAEPQEFERIKSLRNGIRSSLASQSSRVFVFCKAGSYQKLYLVDSSGTVISTDPSKVLSVIRCGREVKPKGLPPNYNAQIMAVKRQFSEEVQQRESERSFSGRLSSAQQYVLRELRAYFQTVGDTQVKATINILENAFRGKLTSAVRKELNGVRRNGSSGEALMGALRQLYQDHNMASWRIDQIEPAEPIVVKIICSEAI